MRDKAINRPPTSADSIHPPIYIAAVFLLLVSLFAINSAAAQSASASQSVVHSAVLALPQIRSANASDTLHIKVGESVVLTSPAPLRRVYIGNPTVLQSYTSGLTEVVLTAKTGGVSSMVLWDETGSNRLYTVFADLDPEALRASLAAAFPHSAIHVETGEGKIFLTGSVATDAASEARWQRSTPRTWSTLW